MTDERQKKTTEEYRSNWDAIFKKQKKDSKTSGLYPDETIVDEFNKIKEEEK